MGLWGWIIIAVIGLIALAAIGEAWLKGRRKRPLSNHSANKRRWDDKNRDAETQHTMRTTWRDSRTGETTEKNWSISRNPHDQAKALMPEQAKPKKDPK